MRRLLCIGASPYTLLCSYYTLILIFLVLSCSAAPTEIEVIHRFSLLLGRVNKEFSFKINVPHGNEKFVDI